MNCAHCGGLTYLDEDRDRACLLCARVTVIPRVSAVPEGWRKKEGVIRGNR